MSAPNLTVSTRYRNYLEWTHTCADGTEVLSLLPYGPVKEIAWAYDKKTDSVAPSILCLGCGCHGWWDHGAWKSLPSEPVHR